MALEYLLRCNCGRKTVVSESLAGTYITCECGRSVAVPKRSLLYELELAPAKAFAATTESATIDAAPPLLTKPPPAIAAAPCCPDCGSRLQPGANYCWLCGRHLAGAQAASTAATVVKVVLITVGVGVVSAAAAVLFVVAAIIASIQQCFDALGGH